jgi:TetR/AcrR family transcriptional regulator, repressor for divergent bdcA
MGRTEVADANGMERRRRPAFDREKGVEIALELFHERGYDAVSVADLTGAIGVVPPSLYAAYGSKAELFDRAMRLYVSRDMLPMERILAPGRDPAEALTELLVEAARHYTRDATRRGCMVTEGMRADDATARRMAIELAEPGSAAIRAYVTRHYPEGARRITDFVLLTLRGLSSLACLGRSGNDLAACARIAGSGLSQELRQGGEQT